MKIGFIGAGQIGSALIEGLLKAEVLLPEELIVKGGSSGTAEKLQAQLGFQLVDSYEAFGHCDYLFLATGSAVVPTILTDLAPIFPRKATLISVSGGHTVAENQSLLGNDTRVVHAIPNTPVRVNEGVTGVSFSKNFTDLEKKKTIELLESLGMVKEVKEELLGTFGTVAGCSPAFVAIFMEALSDAAVMEGLSRPVSFEIISQMILGTAKLAMESKEHPAQLKDGVTSPGGSTIKGVAALEQNGFRYAVIDAVKQANN
ncbi:pyrroline-5-carboxylate reductase [Enterococcus sp. LJL99]